MSWPQLYGYQIASVVTHVIQYVQRELQIRIYGLMTHEV